MGKLNQGYNGNPRLRKAHVQVAMTAAQTAEYAKCEADPIYFIRKYMKIVALGRGIIPFDLYPFQEDMVTTFEQNRFVICKIPRQSGKALPLTEDILTPKGFVKFGDLKVGDKVYGKDGKETTITFITETMYDHDCYDIAFDSGDTIKCDVDHLWEVSCADWENKTKVLTTRDIIEINKKKKKNGSSLYVEMNQAIQFPEKELPIDPYTLGVWLGDGTSRTGQITCHKNDFTNYLNKIPYEIGSSKTDKRNSNVVTFNVCSLMKSLRCHNLMQNKHIPEIYRSSSVEQRLELIRGLMDTDGSITKKGTYEFYQKDEHLVDDFIHILRSLGIKTRKRLKTVNGRIYHTVTFCSDKYSFFHLQRKKEKEITHQFPQNSRLYIKYISISKSVPVRCIQVDNEDHMFLIGKNLIPTHNTITTIAFLLHTILFQENYNLAVLAHKGSAANGILARLKLAYENLPMWLQHGIIEWNKGNIELENGSKIAAYATSADGLRSGSFDMILLDEFAFVANNIADDFFTSTYPVISAGTKTKIIVISTPKGMNHFYEMWEKARLKKSDFITVDVHWSAVPGRDQKWKEATIRNTSEEQFQQEFETEFLGSSSTLISSSKLKQLLATSVDPIAKDMGDALDIYEKPINKHTYVMTVDVSEGLDLDYSAFSIFDVTSIPYKQVAKYRHKKLAPILFPTPILQAARMYNDAFVLVEINSIGLQVADALHYELAYENLIKIETKGKHGQQHTPGFKKKVAFGLKQSVQTKQIGCSNLKALIENDKLQIADIHTIRELTCFVQEKKTYKAEEGANDDLAMTLVNLGWLTSQRYFKEEIQNNIREVLQRENFNVMDSDLVPFGIIDNGLDAQKGQVDADGDLWFEDLQSKYPWDNWGWDPKERL